MPSNSTTNSRLLKVPDGEFIEAWLSSDTVGDVAKRLNVSWGYAGKRASVLRKRGIRLPYKGMLGRNQQIQEALESARLHPDCLPKSAVLEAITAQPCEPECSPERHAYHQGQWDMEQRIRQELGLSGKCDECQSNGWVSNCRWATKRQQKLNQKLGIRNRSGYRGVSRAESSGKWVASLKVDGTRVYLGTFSDKAWAANQYDQFAAQLYGDDARLNFEYT